mmetsp:Transcript_62131/g.102570  ORF Transcript_62131/g.102570 Transcript_62131/m.102570 type:complete len:212 (-) Transcript_62131:248-883(-)
MDHAVLVKVRYTTAHLSEDLLQNPGAHGVVLHVVADGAVGVIGHDNVRHGAVGKDAVDVHDIRVVHLRDNLHFVHQCLAGVFAVHRNLFQNAVVTVMRCLKHFAIPARAQNAFDVKVCKRPVHPRTRALDPLQMPVFGAVFSSDGVPQQLRLMGLCEIRQELFHFGLSANHSTDTLLVLCNQLHGFVEAVSVLPLHLEPIGLSLHFDTSLF